MDEALPSAVIRKWIDPIADRFEREWQAGRPNLAEYLEGIPPERIGPLARELVRLDLEFRMRRGEPASLADYVSFFPYLLNAEGRLDDQLVLEVDRIVRSADGSGHSVTMPWHDNPPATPREVSCPYCREPVTPGETETAICGACGQTFRVSLATAELAPAPQRPRVLGKFQLLALLGEGSFGVVYRARDAELAVDRAIKVPRQRGMTPRERERFLHEARAAAQLVHPHIVPVHEALQRGDLSYIVSDLIEGTTLDEWRLRQRPDFATIARVVAQVADALDYAHERGIVHRDIKPSNILMDREGQPHVTDFGLARRLDDDVLVTREGQIVGTVAYMSPEQAAGRSEQADARSDVYSLGVVLYELLTNERPFRGEFHAVLEQVLQEEPPPPRHLLSAIPVDLETICLKCLAKLPTARYASAKELADDLRRWLEGYPIEARPVTWLEWTWRWCLRNPKLAAAYGASGLLLVAVVVLSIWFGIEQGIARSNLERQLLIERLQQVWRAPHQDGWSKEAWDLVEQAAAYRTDDDLRDYAAATLEGIDFQVDQFSAGPAQSVAFDPQGERVVFGGDRDARARIWKKGEKEPRFVGIAAPGPVAFSAAGHAVQLTAESHSRLRLRNLDQDVVVQTLAFPDEPAFDGAADRPLPSAVITPDGRFAAARRDWPSDDKGNIAIWNCQTGELLRTVRHDATAMALAPDGSLLATGSATGEILIWRLPGGQPFHVLQAQRMQIESLAFHSHPARRILPGGDAWEDPWLLAAGDAGGSVTIWNPTAGRPTAFCRGGQHSIYAVAFSPDGTTLASGGRWEVRLWDVATGHELHLLHGASFKPVFDVVQALAFSPDGRRLALAAGAGYAPVAARVFRLEYGRGIHLLRGLSAELSKFELSPDEKYVAALSHQWQIAVWRIEDGALLRVIDAPKGFSVDNAGIAFSRDSQRLAFSAGKSARVWNLTDGRVVEEWKLPDGLQDSLTFRESGELVVLRYEELDEPRDQPASGKAARKPQVCRVRTLLPGGQFRLEREVADIPWRIEELSLAHDGSYFFAVGRRSAGNEPEAFVAGAWDVATGRGETVNGFTGGIIRGPDGPLGVHRSEGILSFSPGGRSLGRFDDNGDDLAYFDPRLRLAAWKPRTVGGGKPVGITLHQGDPWRPLVCLGIDQTAIAPRFTSDGKIYLWGNLDGTLRICNLEEVRQKLATVGLGWSMPDQAASK